MHPGTCDPFPLRSRFLDRHLAGVNTYVGNTTISGGTLIIDDGSIANSANFVNNAALVYNLNTNARTHGNAISDNGTLTKTPSSPADPTAIPITTVRQTSSKTPRDFAVTGRLRDFSEFGAAQTAATVRRSSRIMLRVSSCHAFIASRESWTRSATAFSSSW